MSDIAEHRLTVARTTRYYTIGPTHGFPRELWIVCHGYAQLAGKFIRDFEPIDNWMDGALIYTGMFACLFNDYSDIRGPIVIYRGLQAQFPSLPVHLGEIVWSGFLVLLMLYGARQTWRVMEGKRINTPKILLRNVYDSSCTMPPP